MKKLFICILCCVPFILQSAGAESIVYTNTPVYPEIQTQIDSIFVTVEERLAMRSMEKQLSFYNTLLSRITSLQKTKPNLSAKNTFLLSYLAQKTNGAIEKLSEDTISLEDLFSGLDEESSIDDTEKSPLIDADEAVVFTRKDNTQNYTEKEMVVGNFEVTKDVKIEKLSLKLVSESEIHISGNQSLRIQREDGLNITLSSLVEFQENSKIAIIDFSADFFIKAGKYKILGNFLHIDNKNYYSYLESIEYGDISKSYEEEEKKIALISVTRDTTNIENGELALSPLRYNVDSFSYNIGAFQVSQEIYFKNIEFKVSANSSIGLEKELLYILDEQGAIYAKGSSYRQEGDVFYISFKNLVLKKGNYKINTTEDISESKYTKIETKISIYNLDGATSVTSKIYKGFTLSSVERK